jgi:epoxyqueuosine reductase
MARHRDRVGNPRAVRAATRSIVAVAMNYYAGEPEPPDPGEEPRGRIARYAWGDDYHLVMEDRLRRLSGAVYRHGATLSRYYVDTGPLMDRAIAQRAGLGWCGRHSCLITREFGTWVVLGEILTDLVLRPDQPASGDCGLCENCMHGSEACPTGAIVASGVVDARKCISYWTIEEACPFNRLARPTTHSEFQPRPVTGTRPALLPLLNISVEEYQRRFRRSPIKRATRSGLRRNVAVALGNLGDNRAVPELIAALNDREDAVVRGHAAWALGRIAGEQGLAALRDASRREQDARVAEEIAGALATST